MADEIEIRSTGEVVANYLTIAQIKFETPYPREFEGKWHWARDEDWQAIALDWEEEAEEAMGAPRTSRGWGGDMSVAAELR